MWTTSKISNVENFEIGGMISLKGSKIEASCWSLAISVFLFKNFKKSSSLSEQRAEWYEGFNAAGENSYSNGGGVIPAVSSTGTHDRDQNVIAPFLCVRTTRSLGKEALDHGFSLETELDCLRNSSWSIYSVRRWTPTFNSMQRSTGSKLPVAGVSTAGIVVTTPCLSPAPTVPGDA